MQIRKSGIVIDNNRHSQPSKVRILKLDKNPFTKYVEMHGVEDGHICHTIFPFNQKQVHQLEAAGWQVTYVFQIRKEQHNEYK